MDDEDKTIKNPKYPYKKPDGIRQPDQKKRTLRSLLPKKQSIPITQSPKTDLIPKIPELPKLPKMPDLGGPPPINSNAPIMKQLEKVLSLLEEVRDALKKNRQRL